MVGPEEVGSMGCYRTGFAEVGAGMVERVGRPDYSTSSFCFALSWTTKLVPWRNSTMLGYSSGNLSVRPVGAAHQQKFGETYSGGRELVTGTS